MSEVLQRARHPYTALLLQCVPNLREARLERMPCLPGQAPGAAYAGARLRVRAALSARERAVPRGAAAIAQRASSRFKWPAITRCRRERLACSRCAI